MAQPHPIPEQEAQPVAAAAAKGVSRSGIAAWMEWYQLAGVEEIIEHQPMPDAWKPAQAATPAPQLASKPVQAAPPARPAHAAPLPQAVATTTAPQSPRVSAKQAETAAAKAQTLAELHEAIRAFDGCALKRTATNTVIADGAPDSGILFIGEAPGSEEDARGIPFCGPSGKLLDKMLRGIGLNRQNSYITNSLYWRPPGNRKPSTEELQSCAPFVWRHIELIKPKIVIMVGGTSASSLLDTPLGITRLRGKQHQLTTPGGYSVTAFALYHPSYLLRQPAHKRFAWQDLLQIKRFLRETYGQTA
jgi:DNA polymerase